MARKKKQTEALSGFPENITEAELRKWLGENGFSLKNAERIKAPRKGVTPPQVVFCPPIERSTDAPESDSWCKVTWTYLKAELLYTVESVTFTRKVVERQVPVQEVVYAEREQ
ncbi:hypothetical protein DBR00_02505 [Pseudomonas sp. HMWF032]|uniref:hypothetical protein n=1 Tax=Pseudomonas sp. HMWF032 TaxID=2056866 RepID=UPI000D33E00C|nr:hypothetical protein [Pseudomonas sp. HMWF032]PTS86446.1 hypothetical protein DBR00_02505 [Pseudomonas sp. HMWF032]PTT81365.1 hypothetical protein DBR41_17025 [Pseudomonas sp. HMWF010]